MKKTLAAALCVAMFAASAQQAPATPVGTFKGALALARLHCTSAFRSAQLDQQLAGAAAAQAQRNYGTTPDYDAASKASVDAAKQFAACMDDARAKGLAAYKAFAAPLPDGKLKAAARAVLAAWLALPGTDDTQSPQWAAYNAAVAELDLDAAGV